MLQSPTPCAPNPIQDQSFTFVDNATGLSEMAAHLSSVREFAVDLEHSSRYGISSTGIRFASGMLIRWQPSVQTRQLEPRNQGSSFACRSFQGFTCLMQISTRSRDYIVDVLSLRPCIGAALARPFADASILKVLHGANSDVLWLQKDFGLFLVNMMDTGQAAWILDLPRGLASLLQHFCQVSV
jgi:exosome complex exonuclease RRP6